MRTRKAKEGEKICIVKVSLYDCINNKIETSYRVLAIPDGCSLYYLAEAIVDSFDFDFDHSFGFYDNTKRWMNSNEGYELFVDMGDGGKFKSVKKTKVNNVFNKINKKMLFLFDYGDEWQFIIELIKIEPPDVNAKYPMVTESVGEVPPQYGEMDEEDV